MLRGRLPETPPIIFSAQPNFTLFLYYSFVILLFNIFLELGPELRVGRAHELKGQANLCNIIVSSSDLMVLGTASRISFVASGCNSGVTKPIGGCNRFAGVLEENMTTQGVCMGMGKGKGKGQATGR